MKVTKFGHCCLLIEHKGKRILTDPGVFSDTQNDVQNIDFILITHEHSDHLHVQSLKKILVGSPDAKVITNTAVGKILDGEGIAYTILEEGNDMTIDDLLFEAFGSDHAEIYDDFGWVQNTGYFIDNTIFYPGDAFTNPGKRVEILALPVSGPWAKISDVIDYVRVVNPAKAFPVHDAVLSDIGRDLHYRLVEKLKRDTTVFIELRSGETKEL